jgi:hypothetical protein
MTGTRGAMVAAAAMSLAVLAAGCSGGGGSDSMDAASAGDAAAASKAQPPAAGLAGSEGLRKTQSGKAGANRPGIQAQAVINTGRATLVAKDLDRLGTDIDRLVAQHGGTIAQEQTTSDDAGHTTSATMQLRVPADTFGTVMHALKDIATVKHSETDSQDVTTQVIDVDARVRSARASLAQLRKFLRQTTDINAMVQLESDIARREAELASMLAQQRYLDDQTAMSTIDLTLTRPARHAAPPKKDDDGFLAGLDSGWDALSASTVVVLTVLGALLPFGVLLVLVGIPVWLLVRRLRPRPSAAAPAPAEPLDT